MIHDSIIQPMLLVKECPHSKRQVVWKFSNILYSISCLMELYCRLTAEMLH
jgi:hypothetical protein